MSCICCLDERWNGRLYCILLVMGKQGPRWAGREMAWSPCAQTQRDATVIRGVPPWSAADSVRTAWYFSRALKRAVLPNSRTQISEKYGLVYVVSKLGFVFVYDLESATAVYRNRISPDPVFLACPSDATGGIYCINRCVQRAVRRSLHCTSSWLDLRHTVSMVAWRTAAQPVFCP